MARGRWCLWKEHGRAFAIYDPAGLLVCIVVYLKGAREVVRRLGGVAVYIQGAKNPPYSPKIPGNFQRFSTDLHWTVGQ